MVAKPERSGARGRQIADRHRWLDESAAVIRLDHSSRDLEQCRFARAVAAHQAQSLGRTDRELGASQQGGAAERNADVFEKEQRWRCHVCCSVLAIFLVRGAIILS